MKRLPDHETMSREEIRDQRESIGWYGMSFEEKALWGIARLFEDHDGQPIGLGKLVSDVAWLEGVPSADVLALAVRSEPPLRMDWLHGMVEFSRDEYEELSR